MLARPLAMAVMAVSHPTAPKDGSKMPADSGKLPKVLGGAAGAAVDAGNRPLFSKEEARGPHRVCRGMHHDGEQLVLHGASPSQAKGWERQGPAALGAAKPPAHSAGATPARLRAITAVSLLKAPSGSRQQPEPALSQLAISVGLGIAGAPVTLYGTVPACPKLLAGRQLGTGWLITPTRRGLLGRAGPRPAGGPCLLPLPVTAAPANDSINPEEASQGAGPRSFSGVTTPFSRRHRLCSRSQTPPAPRSLWKSKLVPWMPVL